MEKVFLYPGDSVIPIEVGDGYNDFLLSDIAASNDAIISYIEYREDIRPGKVHAALSFLGGIIKHYFLELGEGVSSRFCYHSDLVVRYSASDGGTLCFSSVVRLVR